MDEFLTTGQMLDRLLDGEFAINEKGQQVRLDKFGKLIWVNEPVQTPGVVMTSKVLMSRWTIQEGQSSIEKHVQAIMSANEEGIMGVYTIDGKIEVQVTDSLFISLSNGAYTVEKRECSEFPFEVSTHVNGIKYLTICREEELKNEYGGALNELTTTD